MSDKRPNEASSKELAETKRENHKLKRQLAKLQKRLVKLLESGIPTAEDEDQPETLAENASDACPNCGGPLTVVPMGPKTLRACKECKWRKAQ